MAIIVGGILVDSGDNKSNSIVQQESKNTTWIWFEYGKNPSRYCQTFRTGWHKTYSAIIQSPLRWAVSVIKSILNDILSLAFYLGMYYKHWTLINNNFLAIKRIDFISFIRLWQAPPPVFWSDDGFQSPIILLNNDKISEKILFDRSMFKLWEPVVGIFFMK